MNEFPINEINPLTEIRLLRIPMQSYEKLANGEFYAKLIEERMIIYDSQKNEVGFVDIGKSKYNHTESSNELVCEFKEDGLESKYKIKGECTMQIAENGSLSKGYVGSTSRAYEKKIAYLHKTKYTPQQFNSSLDDMQTKYEESRKNAISCLDELEYKIQTGEISNQDQDYLKKIVAKIREQKNEMNAEENKIRELAQNYARQLKN